ncbi:MAG: peptidoglycan synthetase [Bacteroidetes bacterium]|nr:peptidoglycan synthetase [Bacteroidota bacterium]
MNYHFIAIGGAVMHNLALELQHNQHHITGSDDEIFEPAKSRLALAGILPPAHGWFPEKIHPNLDGIILGMHAKQDNPELQRAIELGISIYSFPEFIYHHAQNKTRLVMAGSHGKTTCTGMLMHILKCLQKPFDYLVGSQLPGFERMVKLSDAPLMVIEGDEYLTSPLDLRPKFVHYQAHAAMITGIAWDHVNVFPTEEIYHNQFSLLIDTLQPGGHLFWFNGDEALKNIAQKSGFPQQAIYDAPQYQNVKGGTAVTVNNRVYTLPFYGRHNLQNAAGVVKIASTIGISEEEAWSALQSFPGTAKRLEPILETENLTVIRDFAHAPSKVEASVLAVREQFPNHKFIAVFEVHTYSSLNSEFMQRYQGTLNPADAICVLYDPHVFQLKRMEVPSKETIEQRFGKGQALSDLSSLKNWLSNALETHQPAVVLLMSSGNLCGLSVDYFTDSSRS